jgi:hypothetical protein
LKQFNGSRKDLVCKKALRKKDVSQAVDGRCQRTFASCIRGVGCLESGVAACRKLAWGKANGVRWDGTGSVSGPPLLRDSTRSFHASRGSRLVATVSKGISNGGWSYENGIDHFDSTCFVATVQFWCTVKWHSRRPPGPMIRSGNLASSRNDLQPAQQHSEIRSRKGCLDNACVQKMMEGYFVCCRSAPSATSVCMEGAESARRERINAPTRGKD